MWATYILGSYIHLLGELYTRIIHLWIQLHAPLGAVSLNSYFSGCYAPTYISGFYAPTYFSGCDTLTYIISGTTPNTSFVLLHTPLDAPTYLTQFLPWQIDFLGEPPRCWWGVCQFWARHLTERAPGQGFPVRGPLALSQVIGQLDYIYNLQVWMCSGGGSSSALSYSNQVGKGVNSLTLSPRLRL